MQWKAFFMFYIGAYKKLLIVRVLVISKAFVRVHMIYFPFRVLSSLAHFLLILVSGRHISVIVL